MGQVTMAEVAAAAGTSAMSVSRALRGDPRCSEALRRRVVAAAEELGYRIDPLQSLHMTRVRTGKGKEAGTGSLIAFLDMYGEGFGIPSNPSNRRFLRGAEARAASLGLKVELMAPLREGYGLSRLRQILSARGVQGMVVGPMPAAHTVLEMDFSGLAAVAIAHTLSKPDLHRVGHNHYLATTEALEYLWRKGRRRIGMAIENSTQERVGRRWHAAYYEFFESRAAERFETFRFEWDAADWEGRRAWFGPVCEWVARHRLDAVIGLDPWIMEALAGSGYRVPEDVLYFDMDWYPGKSDWRPPCIDQQFEAIGAAAVDQIVGQWARYEYGVPQNALSIMLNGKINEGQKRRS